MNGRKNFNRFIREDCLQDRIKNKIPTNYEKNILMNNLNTSKPSLEILAKIKQRRVIMAWRCFTLGSLLPQNKVWFRSDF